MMKEKTKVLVIGDSCLDVFQYGRCERLSPEAPVPVFLPTKKKENGGMALNVLNNLKALGVECDILTNKFLSIKTRYVDEISNQMLIRIDENDNVKRITQEELESINLDNYAAVMISDYNKGYLDIDDIMWIADNHSLTFIDTKKELGEWCNKIKFIKINKKEYDRNSKYLDNKYPHNAVITLGKDGALLILNNNGIISKKYFSIEEEHDVRDLSGAGDTFFAALVASYLKNNDICDAINFANKCASWVVTQKGVVVVDVNKIDRR